MHTVELVPDPALDAGVRDLWARLHAAGLPSLATHRHPTNAPHVTLTSAPSLAGLPALDLPVQVTLGPARMLGRALVRPADSPQLRDLHAAVWQAVGGENPLHAPELWVPHVSLALNVPPDRREAAVALLADLTPVGGELVGARSYDTQMRTVIEL